MEVQKAAEVVRVHEVPEGSRCVVLRDELAVRVQLLGQAVCVLVHHHQLLTEVERPPHREHAAVHHVITSNTPSLRLSRSKHTHEVHVHVATVGLAIPRNLVHEGIWFMGASCLRGGGGNKDWFRCVSRSVRRSDRPRARPHVRRSDRSRVQHFRIPLRPHAARSRQ